MPCALDSRTRVLIADDEGAVRSVLQDFLSDCFDCVTVDCAERALSLLREEQFPVVISDIEMSGMTGLQLVPQVLRWAPDTQVILVSGSQDIEHVIEALRVGAFDYITKPFDLRELDATMQRAVEHYDLRTAKRRYEDQLRELVEQRTAALDGALNSLEGA
ncbi:MAG: response regulator, partial [Acidobacteria bacterium]|nr:response regulator [Acidobacteriota bacterium]